VDPAPEDRALTTLVCFSGLAARAAVSDPRIAFDTDSLGRVGPAAESAFGSIDAWLACLEGQDHLDPLHHGALYLYGVGAWGTWAADNPPPRALVGYSLGVYVALTAAGSLELEDGLPLVVAAGEGIRSAQSGLGHGLLAVNGLPVDRVADVLEGLVPPGEVALTHVNTPSNYLLTCPGDAIDGLCERALELGAYTASRASFPGAAHSPFMERFLDSYFSRLSGIHLVEPRLPLLSCVTAEIVTSATEVRALLHDQLIRPVRFLDTIEKVRELRPDAIVVVGTCEGIPALLAFLEPDAEVQLRPGRQRER